VKIDHRIITFSDMMAVSKYSGLEGRMANIEERLRERAGNADRQG